MDALDNGRPRGFPDVATGLGLGIVAWALATSTRQSPVPWSAEPAPVVWAALAVAAALVAAWRPAIGLALVGLTAVEAGLRPLDADPNEVAGALAPLAPLLLARAARIERSAPDRWLAPLALAVLVARLATTGSRGGLAAATAGVAVFAWLAFGRALRWRWLAAGGALVALGASLAIGSAKTVRHWADRWLRAGESDGWSWNTWLSGRPTIWARAIELLGDVPRHGVGPGRFDDAVRAYPLAPFGGVVQSPDDAHQATLQLALDLGLPAALVVATLVGLGAWRLVRSTLAAGSHDRRYLAGLTGALACVAVFGLADTVPLGSPAAIVGWALLGLALGMPPTRRWHHRLWYHRRWRGGLAVALAAAVGAGVTAEHAPLDRASRDALRALLGHGPSEPAHQRLDALAATAPRALWLRGALDHFAGHPAERDAAWSRLVASADRTPSRLGLLAAVAPEHRPLARFAVRTWPTKAGAWRWLATADRESARYALRRALALDPNADDTARLWLALGHLDEAAGARRSALDAYAHACRTGDPGANACGEAGRLAAELGDTDRARRLYRCSRWPPIRAEAQRLRP